MRVSDSTIPTKATQRVAAVLALFRGTPVSQLTAQFGICRSDLSKLRQRALIALQQALQNQPRGPRHPPTWVSAD